MVYQPKQLRAYLESLGVSPKKALSQNFLIDGNVLKKIVSMAGIEPGDAVLEIGPGPGALTEQLLKAGAEVTAVEKDRVLAKGLERLSCRVIEGDILETDVDRLGLGKSVKVIANLPYRITTPIIERLVKRHDLFSTLTLMVQKEVAERFTAEHGSKTFGSISVFLRFFSHPKMLFTVKKGCFYPPPKVDSAVIQLELKEPPVVSDQGAFFGLVRTAFGQRRKMVTSTLRSIYDQDRVGKALEALGYQRSVRPEMIGLEGWLKLYALLSHPINSSCS